MTLALLGEGEMLEDGRKVPAAEALAKAGIAPLRLAAEGGAGADQRHPDLDRSGAACALSFEPVLESALVIGALTVDARAAARWPV